MRRVKCEDCGKHYDYDEDAFCPYCGAFNQPDRQKSDFESNAKPEEDHKSFLSEEMQGEKRGMGMEKAGREMEKQITRLRQSMARSAAQAEQRTRQEGEVPDTQNGRKDKSGVPALLSWIIGLIALIKLIGTIFANH